MGYIRKVSSFTLKSNDVSDLAIYTSCNQQFSGLIIVVSSKVS